MASPQSTVPSTPVAGINGAPADFHTAQNGKRKTATNGEVAAGIPFGVFVQANGATEDSCKLLTEDADILGLHVHSDLFDNPSQIDANGKVLPGNELTIAEDGCYFVMPEDDVTPASGVHIRHTAAGAEVLGAVRGTADAGDTYDASGLFKWRSSGGPTSGQPAILDLKPVLSGLVTEDS